jgi:hypothetical protein
MVYTGIVLVAAGLGGLGLCIRKAVRLRAIREDSDAVRRQLHGLVALNMGAVALAFIGLGLVGAGLMLD